MNIIITKETEETDSKEMILFWFGEVGINDTAEKIGSIKFPEENEEETDGDTAIIALVKLHNYENNICLRIERLLTRVFQEGRLYEQKLTTGQIQNNPKSPLNIIITEQNGEANVWFTGAKTPEKCVEPNTNDGTYVISFLNFLDDEEEETDGDTAIIALINLHNYEEDSICQRLEHLLTRVFQEGRLYAINFPCPSK